IENIAFSRQILAYHPKITDTLERVSALRVRIEFRAEEIGRDFLRHIRRRVALTLKRTLGPAPTQESSACIQKWRAGQRGGVSDHRPVVSECRTRSIGEEIANGNTGTHPGGTLLLPGSRAGLPATPGQLRFQCAFRRRRLSVS